jgi:polyphenol oxidase
MLTEAQKSSDLLIWFGNKSLPYDRVLQLPSIRIQNQIIDCRQLVCTDQTHSDNIVNIDTIENYDKNRNTPLLIADCDALVTSRKNVYLAIKTADCVPILLHDRQKEVIAAIHSGMIGTAKNITGKTIDLIFSFFGSEPKDIRAYLGPAICPLHYPVAPESFDSFVASTGVAQKEYHLDLKKVVIDQLASKGIYDVSDKSVCTYEDNDYFSYRRDKTEERQITIIGLRNGI